MSTAVVVPNEDRVMMTGFGDIPANCITVASVHFRPVRYDGFFHSRNRDFNLAAGKLGEPTYLKVWNSQQFVQDEVALLTYQEGSPTPGGIPYPVRAGWIVNDLLKKWQPYFSTVLMSDSNGKKKPHLARMPDVGIIAIKGSVTDAEELKRLNDLETAHCRAVVDQADRFYINGEGMITDYHRDALAWLGSELKPWFLEIQSGTTKVSPISGKRIPMKALADDGLDLLAFYQRNGLDPTDYGDTFAAELLTRPNVKNSVAEAIKADK